MLTTGAVNRIKAGDTMFQPTLLISSIKAMGTQPTATSGAGDKPSPAQLRFRLLLSDGVESIAGMPATQLNQNITDGYFKEGTVVKLQHFQINTIPSSVNDPSKPAQQIVIILKMEAVGEQPVVNIPAVPTFPAQPAYAEAPKPYGGVPYGGAPYGSAPMQQQAAPDVKPLYHPQYPAQAPAAMPTSYAPATNTPYGAGGVAARPVVPSAPVANPYPNAYQQIATPTPPLPTPVPAASTYNNPYATPTNRPIVKDDHINNAVIVPISAINPYSSKWTIKARITTKSEMRRWSNAKGEGTLFSIDLLDSHGGEIRGTFFKDACDKFFPVLEEGKVYTFSGGVLKIVTNKQYTTIKNQYELTFNANSEIRAVADDISIQGQHYEFIRIDQLINQEPNNIVDIIGVVKSATDPMEIISKNLGGKTLNKRDLTIMDQSGYEIRLTLWGEKALSNQYNWSSQPIVAMKGCKVGDYQGRTLSTMNSSSIVMNPNIPEGIELHQWRMQFQGGQLPTGSSLSGGGMNGAGGVGGVGGNNSVEPLEKRKNILAIKEEGLGMGEKGDFVTIKGAVIYIKHDNDPWYTACPTPNCNKKVIETMNGQYSCEKCNKLFPECHRRFILSINMADHTGSNWFSLFNDTAEKLLGTTAEQLYNYKQHGHENEYEAVFANALFKTFVGKIRIKQEQVNDEKRIKSSFITIHDVEYISESKQLLDAISKYA